MADEDETTGGGALFGSETLGDIRDFLQGGGAQGLAGIGLLLNAYNQLGGIGERGLGLGQDLATTQLEQAAFRPYTVTTATGGQFSAGPDGQYTMAMSCLLYTSPSPRDGLLSRMPSSA